MKFSATPATAALAGFFSALTWPFLWPLFHETSTSSSVLLLLGTIGFIALPAHVFVVGFRQAEVTEARTLDTALLKRVAAWALAAAVAALAIAWYRN